MADNFQVTQGSGTIIAAHQNGDLSLEQKVQVTVAPSTLAQDATLIGGNIKTQIVDGSGHTLNVDPSGTARVNVVTTVLPTGASTDTVATNGTQKTQLVDGTGDVAAISAVGAVSVDINQIGVNALGQELMTASIPVVIASNQSVVPVSGSFYSVASSAVSITGTTGTAVTATLPASVGNFHYISLIHIQKIFTAANAASATPLVVTSTNLPGPLAWSFGQPVGAIGVTIDMILPENSMVKSSVVNTATTIICPATTGIIWRVNVTYFTAP